MATMEITDVRIKMIDGDKGTLKANASVTFNDCFVVHGLKVIESDKGTFVAMPSRKGEDGKFIDICHPLNNDMRNAIKDAVLDKYNVMK